MLRLSPAQSDPPAVKSTMIDDRNTLAILLGVSVCPRAPALEPLPQCANSARKFRDYLNHDLSVPAGNILDLFDSNEAPSNQLDSIEEWLATKAPAKDYSSKKISNLIIYYTGHAGFSRNDQSYFLATRKTRTGSEGATSIRYVDLASAIKRCALSVRRYYILDCCFAAASVLRMQSELTELVKQRVEEASPDSGTAVLCSSAAKLVSIAPEGEEFTMFSGALLGCLQDGLAGGPKALSLEDVEASVRKRIAAKFPNDAVRPELHAPDQSFGDPARVPLFPNILWQESLTNAETDNERQESAPRSTKKIPMRALLWIGGIAGAGGATSGELLPLPFGIETDGPIEIFDLPLLTGGVAAVICLSLGVSLAGYLQGERRIFLFIALPIITYVAWLFALNATYRLFLVLLDKNIDRIPISISSISLISGGLIGSIIPLSLIFLFSSVKLRTKRDFLYRSIIPTALICGIIGLYVLHMFPIDGISLPFLIALFVPWQMAFVGSTKFLYSSRFDWRAGASVLWLTVCCVTTFAGVFVLSRENVIAGIARISGDIPGLKLYVVEVKPAIKGEKMYAVLKFGIRSSGRNPLNCGIEGRIHDRIFKPDYFHPSPLLLDTDNLTLFGSADFALTREEVEPDAEEAEARDPLEYFNPGLSVRVVCESQSILSQVTVATGWVGTFFDASPLRR